MLGGLCAAPCRRNAAALGEPHLSAACHAARGAMPGCCTVLIGFLHASTRSAATSAAAGSRPSVRTAQPPATAPPTTPAHGTADDAGLATAGRPAPASNPRPLPPSLHSRHANHGSRSAHPTGPAAGRAPAAPVVTPPSPWLSPSWRPERRRAQRVPLAAGMPPALWRAPAGQEGCRAEGLEGWRGGRAADAPPDQPDMREGHRTPALAASVRPAPQSPASGSAPACPAPPAHLLEHLWGGQVGHALRHQRLVAPQGIGVQVLHEPGVGHHVLHGHYRRCRQYK
jgi:hypothetical protein